MSLRKAAKFVITRTPYVRDVYSRLRPTIWGYGSRSTYRDDFVEFIAQRRGIEPSKARALVTAAEKQFHGGWGGDEYRHFTELALETFRPLYDDHTDTDAIETYRFHSGIDFLRMLGYAVPTPKDVAPIIHRLAGIKRVALVDYGFGLAHRTIAISRCLLRDGLKVKLYLVDIRRELHLVFVDFLCRKYGIDYQFIEITPEHLYPELPDHHYCDNVSVLEHVREPMTVVNNIDRSLHPGGLFLALVSDAVQEMMHISPNLRAVRDRLAGLGYQRVGMSCGVPLYQKPGVPR